MSDEATEAETDADTDGRTERTTAPMSEFSTGQVAVGLLVLAVGLGVAFGVPLFGV